MAYVSYVGKAWYLYILLTCSNYEAMRLGRFEAKGVYHRDFTYTHTNTHGYAHTHTHAHTHNMLTHRSASCSSTSTAPRESWAFTRHRQDADLEGTVSGG